MPMSLETHDVQTSAEEGESEGGRGGGKNGKRGGGKGGYHSFWFMDSDAAPVRGRSLSRDRETREGEGEREEAGKQPGTYPSTVSP